MKYKFKLQKIGYILKGLISTTFILSALGKFFDPNITALNLVLLIPLSAEIAKILVYILSLFELTLAIMIWWRMLTIYLLIPVIFWGFWLISYLKGMNCGCFGSLPILNHISPLGHFLLILGVFLGFYFLAAVNEKFLKEVNRIATDSTHSRSLKWVGYFTIAIMLIAFIPFPSSFWLFKNNPTDNNSINVVGRAYVQAAITYGSSVIVDARPAYQYNLGHLPEAINIPYYVTNLETIISQYSLSNKEVIVYCSSVRCNVAEILVNRLLKLGLKNVRLYAGGWEDWQNSR